MSAEYVRGRYNVPAKVGQRVVMDGRPGVIVSFPGQYVGVRFDGERHTSQCHPTWRMTYGGTEITEAMLDQETGRVTVEVQR